MANVYEISSGAGTPARRTPSTSARARSAARTRGVVVDLLAENLRRSAVEQERRNATLAWAVTLSATSRGLGRVA
ncbi:hypothetical protein [Nocardioides sp. GY 10127]|uniref:hypothetical protein n=1 Tax=Nocardioides sp. GY 10127 TaxID=2569762 RepID=UPI0010A90D7D|nr:hypothetical protein [Nocardioides sp. GY 10127]TIC81557.1 hypothetical protein E8D37_10040 [Nocardioides sp. GY 10127]